METRSFFLLGGALLFMAYLTIRLENQVNKNGQKITEIQNNIDKGSKNANLASTENKTPNNRGNNSAKNTALQNSRESKNLPVSKVEVPKSTTLQYSANSNNLVVVSSSRKSKEPEIKAGKQSTKRKSKQVANISNNEVAIVSTENKETGLNTIKSANAVVSNNSETQKSEPPTPAPPINENIFTISSSNPDKVNQTQPTITPKPLQTVAQMVDSSANRSSSRFSLSAYFSPDLISGCTLKNNGSGNKYVDAIKNGEKANFSYSTGIKLEYELSSKLSIGASLNYQSFSFQIAPTYLYAQKQSDGQIGYSIISSSGIIDCPNYGNTVMGDSIQMAATSTRRYLGVPITLKYFILDKSKFRIFLEGGAGINISVNTQTNMTWQYWQINYSAYAPGVEGLQSIYYSYSAGLGASYNPFKRITFYAEPTLQGSITSINKNTPVISYPYLLGITAGATYHF